MPPRTRRSQLSGSKDPTQGPSDENVFHLQSPNTQSPNTQSPNTPTQGAVSRPSPSTTQPNTVVQTPSKSTYDGL